MYIFEHYLFNKVDRYFKFLNLLIKNNVIKTIIVILYIIIVTFLNLLNLLYCSYHDLLSSLLTTITIIIWSYSERVSNWFYNMITKTKPYQDRNQICNINLYLSLVLYLYRFSYLQYQNNM